MPDGLEGLPSIQLTQSAASQALDAGQWVYAYDEHHNVGPRYGNCHVAGPWVLTKHKYVAYFLLMFCNNAILWSFSANDES